MNEEMDGARDDGGVLEGKEIRCSSESESEATAPIQSENEREKAGVSQKEESDGHMEDLKEKQHSEDTSMEINSSEEPPKEPQPELEEHQTEEPLVVSVEAQSGCDPEPAKISDHSCTAAQEMTETPVQ